jgi:hypothetical protein
MLFAKAILKILKKSKIYQKQQIISEEYVII